MKKTVVRMIPADVARTELTTKTHLNRHQIERILGGKPKVKASLITSIIKVSDAEKSARSPEPSVKIKSKRRWVTKKRTNTERKYSLKSAKDVMVQFGESKAL